MARFGILRGGKVAEAFDLPATINASDPAAVLAFLTVHRSAIAPVQDWVLLPEGTQNGATANGDGSYTPPPATSIPVIVPDPTLLNKSSGLRYDDFRKLFTQAQLMLLENYDSDAYFTGVGKTPLTVSQKAQVRFFIGEATATGGGVKGINLLSPKMAAACDALVAMSIISPSDKADIQAGKIKS
jgi:hypothetical protein